MALETGNVRKDFLFYFTDENADTQRGQNGCQSEGIVYNWKKGSTISVYHNLNIKHPLTRFHSEAEQMVQQVRTIPRLGRRLGFCFQQPHGHMVAQNHL